MAKNYEKQFEKVVEMYLGRFNCSGYYTHKFKPYALLFTICLREVKWYADAYSISDLEKLLKFTNELPKQKQKKLVIDFFIERTNQRSWH
ncbi:MAG: hypothetical protein J0I84_06645 [Terrimonas sp.]|nr:hypothetical protein [Terrimonas sp.]OJY92204.1 MAG: hypothetical protein BGP13_08555 [Sphingobacteriales bacterium 40-81]